MTDEIRHRVAWHGVAIAIALEIIATGLAMLVSAAGAWAVCAIFVVAAAVSSWKAAWVGAVTSIGASALLLTFLFAATGRSSHGAGYGAGASAGRGAGGYWSVKRDRGACSHG